MVDAKQPTSQKRLPKSKRSDVGTEPSEIEIHPASDLFVAVAKMTLVPLPVSNMMSPFFLSFLIHKTQFPIHTVAVTYDGHS